MASATIRYFSRSLSKASSLTILFPDDPAIRPPWATFYLLHGMADDHTTWSRRSRIERHVDGLPLVVVMPDGGRGWYTDACDGDAYEDDLLRDVMGLVERTFPVRADRAGRAIGGLSMGGYGAVKLGLKYPNLFKSVNSHSGALGVARDRATSRPRIPEYDRIFGPSPAGGPDDPFALADRIEPAGAPALLLDCGRDDFLLGDNRDFHRHLMERGIAHTYEEFPGGHDWDYWDRHVVEAVAFHMRNLAPSG